MMIGDSVIPTLDVPVNRHFQYGGSCSYEQTSVVSFGRLAIQSHRFVFSVLASEGSMGQDALAQEQRVYFRVLQFPGAFGSCSLDSQ